MPRRTHLDRCAFPVEESPVIAGGHGEIGGRLLSVTRRKAIAIGATPRAWELLAALTAWSAKPSGDASGLTHVAERFFPKTKDD